MSGPAVGFVLRVLEAYLNSRLVDGEGWVTVYRFLSSPAGWFDQADIILLAVMLVNTIVIVCHQYYSFGIACRQSRAFVREAQAPLRAGRFDEVISVAARYHWSHVATVVGAGLTAFVAAPPEFTDTEAITASERALLRSYKMTSRQLRLGLGTLATVSSSAPFIGLLGTVFGILHASRGVDMEKSAFMRMMTSSLAEALASTAMGLLVGTAAVWCRNYLCDRVAVFESEISNASLETITYLSMHREGRSEPEHLRDGKDFLLGGPNHSAAHLWEVAYDRQRGLLLAMCLCALFFAFTLVRGVYSHWSYVPQNPYAGNYTGWVPAGGQETVSPDHRYRALVPTFFRQNVYRPGSGDSHWLCASSPEVTLRIVPNDRSRVWSPHLCGNQTVYSLEPDEVLLSWNCSVPVVAWRTNHELLIQCSGCSRDNLQLVRPAFFRDKVTVLGSDGKRINLQVAHPLRECAY